MQYTIEDFKGYNFDGALRKIWKDHIDEFLMCYKGNALGCVTVKEVIEDLCEQLEEGKLFKRSDDLWGDGNTVRFADKYFKDIWYMTRDYDIYELGEQYEFLTNTPRSLGLMLGYFISWQVYNVVDESNYNKVFNEKTYKLLLQHWG